MSSLERMKAHCRSGLETQIQPWPEKPDAVEEPSLWIKGWFPLLEGQTFRRIMTLAPEAEALWVGPKDQPNLGILRLNPRLQPPLALNQIDLAEQYGEGFAYFEMAEPSWRPLANGQDFSFLSQVLFQRNAARAVEAGVCLVAPQQTWIEDDVAIATGAWIGPSVYLGNGTRIEAGVQIHQGCWLKNVSIDEGAILKPYSVLESSRVGKRADIGPFAHLRRGTELGEGTRVGNFVETKNATLGNGSKASHLSYLGDATVGEGCNIGAGTIFCNYDGFNKWQTTMGNGVFIGSNSELVAPVSIGDGALVAAGSTITKDVPADSLAIARSKQVNKDGRAARIFEKAEKAKK